MPAFPQIAPPRALERPQTTVVHGQTLIDEYAWLRAENWREALDDPSVLDPAIRAHLETENAYADAMLGWTKALQERLVAEMRGRIREDDSSVPAPDGPYAYLRRFREGGEHPLFCRVPREGGVETMLLDGDALAQGRAYFAIGAVAHSPDHALIAWSLDAEGSENYTIRVRPAGSAEDMPDRAERTTGDVVWCADCASFLYVELDDNHRPVRVRRHVLGTEQAADALVYEEPEPGWFVSIDRTQSGRFAAIVVSDHETSETRLLALDAPEAPPRIVVAREPGIRYGVEDHGDRLIIVTNADGAEDFKIVEAPLADPSRENWRDLVPHRPGVMILSATPFARHLARLEREDARPRIVLRDLATGEEHAVAFDEEAYSLGLSAGFEFDTDTLRFGYSSLARPNETWDYDMATRERTLRKREEPPSGHDPQAYVTRRVFATTQDGERAPISLLYRKGALDDGPAPCLLYGYGSYGHAIPASFRSNILSLVDRGFVYAIAHIRGGTEKGWGWYVAGKKEKKTNTFGDFLACAQALCEQGFTRRGAIVAHGGSAGGMLMGAVANDDPGAFAGIVAEVPFVDVLNTMLDAELPLTPPEWPEWGNPGESREAFETIRGYSPYDNVAAQDYPPILALAGLTDPRVTYWEPAKWVARLRATMTGGGPVILRTQMEAGHGGVSGRFRRLEEIASIYAFALACVGRIRA
ncbi:MAG: S9 family peptidase [Salinarimonadaceae bacterium]|nr:MAG: S9 family peptidase [Salinarimonadaceae bacterium]